METKREKRSPPLHAFVSRHELNLGERKGVPKMKRSVHVRICHTCKELWVLLPQFSHCHICFWRRAIQFPNLLLLPYLLIFPFDCNGRIAFLCLYNRSAGSLAVRSTSFSCFNSTIAATICSDSTKKVESPRPKFFRTFCRS